MSDIAPHPFGTPFPLSVPEKSLLAFIAEVQPATTPEIRECWMHPNGVTTQVLQEILERMVSLGYLNKTSVPTGKGRIMANAYTRTEKPLA